MPTTNHRTFKLHHHLSVDSQISQLQTKVNNLDQKLSHLTTSAVPSLRNDVSSLQSTVVPFTQVIENITQTGGLNPLSFTSANKDSVTLSKGTPVTQDASGSGVVRADASVNKPVCGIANADIAVAVSGEIIAGGLINLSDWSGITGTSSLVAKGKYFLSTTAGKLTNTPTTSQGNYSQLVGIAVDPQTLEIKIGYSILL